VAARGAERGGIITLAYEAALSEARDRGAGDCGSAPAPAPAAAATVAAAAGASKELT
jgi:hypothetical protein